jgi:hypothetical protein
MTRTYLKNVCHSRTFQSGVQNALSGFPLKTSGNDNPFITCVIEMASTLSSLRAFVVYNFRVVLSGGMK